MSRSAAGRLVLALSLSGPAHSADAQARAPLTPVPRTEASSRAMAVELPKGTRMALGAVGGAVVGGAAGYLITRSACTRCDDAAFMLFGAGIGAIAGATVGIVISRQQSLSAGEPGDCRARAGAPSMKLGLRVAR